MAGPKKSQGRVPCPQCGKVQSIKGRDEFGAPIVYPHRDPSTKLWCSRRDPILRLMLSLVDAVHDTHPEMSDEDAVALLTKIFAKKRGA